MSSNPEPILRTASSVCAGASGPGRPRAFVCIALASVALAASQVAAQNDAPVTPPDGADAEAPPSSGQNEVEDEEEPLRVDLSVTVPRGEVNEAKARECEDRADAGEISGDIVVCRRLGEKGENSYSGSRSEAQKRYASETAFKGSPSAPGLFGIADNGRGIGIGGVPPPALIIDVEALPSAPPGSDADRIARGLPPLGQDEDLSEEEIRKRREALGLPPPSFERKGN